MRATQWFNSVLMAIMVWLAIALLAAPAYAATPDPYVTRYLRATEPVPLDLNAQGETRLFSPIELSVGKRLFEENCKNCHVGGSTLPNPLVSLSLDTLKSATPPRDTIDSLVSFMRQPMTYDGTDEALECRQVPEDWMSRDQVEALSAFILRAAQKTTGWGTERF